MTEKVKKYIELSEQLDDAVDTENEELEIKLSEEFASNRAQMTVDELKCLKNYVSTREFHLGIMPLIKAKQTK